METPLVERFGDVLVWTGQSMDVQSLSLSMIHFGNPKTKQTKEDLFI